MQRTKFFVILGHLLPFDPPNNPKDQNFEKIKKLPGNIIILHLCATNDDHMMYDSWDMECNRQKFFSFWTLFCPFSPPSPTLTTQRIKILKKWKKTLLRYHHFTQVHHKWQSYDIWFLRYQLQQTDFFCHLGAFLPFYPPNSPKKENIKKMKKLPGNIILHKWTKNHEWS